MKMWHVLDYAGEKIKPKCGTFYPNFPDHNWSVWNEKEEDYVDPDLSKYLRSLNLFPTTFFNKGLQPDTVVIFKGRANQFMDIHCDRGPTWALNYSWGSTDSEMLWYRSLEEPTQSEMCSIGSPYLKYDTEKCEVVDVMQTNPHLNLVRIDVPHNIRNKGNTDRWTLSVRDLTSKLTWKQAVERFKPWITT
jgi:hypothetical protein